MVCILKLKVALRNLYISQAIILVFLAFAYFLWFPHSFTKLGGFYKTAGLLIFVDLVLGPLLVYFIYKENKKFLKFDINVLLGIQLIAFIFGAYSLFLKHPAYAVFSVDRFVLTNVSSIYPQLPWSQRFNSFFSKPKFVTAYLPKNNKEKNNLTLDIILNGQPDIDARPRYFKPFDFYNDSVMSKSIKLEKLDLDSNDIKKLKIFNKKHEGNSKYLAYFPLRGNNKKDMVWAFDKRTGEPINIIDIDPWKFKTASNSYREQ